MSLVPVVPVKKPWAYSNSNITGNIMLAQTDPKIFVGVNAWDSTSTLAWQIPGWICRSVVYKQSWPGIYWDYKYRQFLGNYFSEQLPCLSNRRNRETKNILQWSFLSGFDKCCPAFQPDSCYFNIRLTQNKSFIPLTVTLAQVQLSGQHTWFLTKGTFLDYSKQ